MFKPGDEVICIKIFSTGDHEGVGYYYERYAEDDGLKVGQHYTISSANARERAVQIREGRNKWWHPDEMFELVQTTDILAMVDALDEKILALERRKSK